MSCDICKICSELKFEHREHICPPKFYFKYEDWGDEWQEIRAYSFRDAAEKFAIKYNQVDYALMNKEVEVIISNDKTKKTFVVSAEPDIYYSIEEIGK